MMTRRRSGLAALVTPVAIALALLGCGTPTGPDSFSRIDEVPNRLDEATTTTSTVVTTTSTTTTLPDAPLPTDAPVVTAPTQIVEIFFLSRNDLRGVERQAPSPTTANDLILLLEEGPSTPLLNNLFEENLIRDTTRSGGVVTIDLDGEIYDRVRDRQQRDLIAQIVLTFLSDRGLPGVGLAVFTLDGEPLSVPTGSGQFTDDPVSSDDYADMLVDADPAPEVTTTVPAATTTTTTTEAGSATTVDDDTPGDTATSTVPPTTQET